MDKLGRSSQGLTANFPEISAPFEDTVNIYTAGSSTVMSSSVTTITTAGNLDLFCSSICAFAVKEYTGVPFTVKMFTWQSSPSCTEFGNDNDSFEC